MAKPVWLPRQPLSPHSLSGASSNQGAAQPFQAPPTGGWVGGAMRWCRGCCMSGCSNLDPVRRGSLIPDYGSLGLRHADAQVCTHLQSLDLSIWLSALNLKPRWGESIKVKAVVTALLPEMRGLVEGVDLNNPEHSPCLPLDIFLPFDVMVHVCRMICGVLTCWSVSILPVMG